MNKQIVMDFILEREKFSKNYIKKKLKIDENELDNILDKLEEELYISFKGGFYICNVDKNHKIGILKMTNENYGFVSIDGEDIYVKKENINGALDGDRVLIKILEDRQKRKCAHILKREATKKKLAGIVYEENDKLYIKSVNNKYKNLKIEIPRNSGVYVDNQVLVSIDNKAVNGIYQAKLEQILGYKNDPGIDILSILKEKDVPTEFPQSVLDELKEVPFEVNEIEIEDRVDLRDEITFTIDGADAKDFDDAISIKKISNENYEVCVHIADVSYYVKQDSEIDKEAKKRGTSIYLADRVVPMLPPKLSNGICSLNPNVDRLTITYKMVIDGFGRVRNYDIFESVINSNKRMKYHEVNKVLDGEIVDGYEPYLEQINMMYKVAKSLRERRFIKGSLDLDIPEIKLEIAESGKPTNILTYDRGESEKIIEEFMLAANTVAARYATNLITHIYRNHESPNLESLLEAKKMIKSMGYDFNFCEKNGNITARAIEESLNLLRDEECYSAIANIVLRSLKRANYSTENKKHFALSFNHYAHNTSPIRRYPDLVNQRLFKSVWHYDEEYLSKYEELENNAEMIAKSSSMRERIADDCEREVIRMKSAEYLNSYIGEEFDAMINAISSKNICVQLKNQIEGIISTENLDGFKYDEEKYCLKSNTGEVYKLGQDLKVVLIKSDKQSRKIEFIPKEEKIMIKK